MDEILPITRKYHSELTSLISGLEKELNRVAAEQVEGTAELSERLAVASSEKAQAKQDVERAIQNLDPMAGFLARATLFQKELSEVEALASLQAQQLLFMEKQANLVEQAFSVGQQLLREFEGAKPAEFQAVFRSGNGVVFPEDVKAVLIESIGKARYNQAEAGSQALFLSQKYSVMVEQDTAVIAGLLKTIESYGLQFEQGVRGYQNQITTLNQQGELVREQSRRWMLSLLQL